MLRVTAGIINNVEIGAAFSTSIERIFVGSKYIFLNGDKYSAGLATGFSLPAGNEIQSDSDKINSTKTFSIGLIQSLKLNETITIDAQFVGTNKQRNLASITTLNYGIGVGNWFTEKFQGVFEILRFNCN